MIQRAIESRLQDVIDDSKVIILFGARQVGKTTILKEYLQTKETLILNGDEPDIRLLLKDATSTGLKSIIGNHKRLIIDEAQRIENIGLTLKLIHDSIPEIKVIATGSSAFELANSVNEPLTGRKWEFQVWPISISEMIEHTSMLEEKRMLEHRLLYGYYPEIINHIGQEKSILHQLSDSYLYKDILTWENIKKPQKLESLLQALAFQIGNEVSYNELSKTIGLDNQTIERYISLLEKAYIVFRLPALSRNLRNELKKGKKIYFTDVGIRNAIIKNFNPLGLRNDVGPLWENFLIVERLKFKSISGLYSNDYFWRTTAQQEIDYIEEYNGIMHAYEFKWNEKRKARFSKTFTNSYPNHTLMTVSKNNYLDFITKSN